MMNAILDDRKRIVRVRTLWDIFTKVHTNTKIMLLLVLLPCVSSSHIRRIETVPPVWEVDKECGEQNTKSEARGRGKADAIYDSGKPEVSNWLRYQR